MEKYKRTICPVCQQYEFDEPDSFDICPICGWQDDPYQRDCPDEDGGANELSLNQARKVWARGEKVR